VRYQSALVAGWRWLRKRENGVQRRSSSELVLSTTSNSSTYRIHPFNKWLDCEMLCLDRDSIPHLQQKMDSFLLILMFSITSWRLCETTLADVIDHLRDEAISQCGALLLFPANHHQARLLRIGQIAILAIATRNFVPRGESRQRGDAAD